MVCRGLKVLVFGLGVKFDYDAYIFGFLWLWDDLKEGLVIHIRSYLRLRKDRLETCTSMTFVGFCKLQGLVL